MRRKRRGHIGVRQQLHNLTQPAYEQEEHLGEDDECGGMPQVAPLRIEGLTAQQALRSPVPLPPINMAAPQLPALALPPRVSPYDSDLFANTAMPQQNYMRPPSQPTSPRGEDDHFDIYFYRTGDAAAAGLGNRHLERPCVGPSETHPQIITQYHGLEIIAADGTVQRNQSVVLLESLGKGAFATCYKAEYNGEIVAVKILHTALHPKSKRDAFERELYALRKTADCDLTLDLIGYRPAPHYWLITPFMNEGTLHDKIKATNGQPLHLQDVLDIGTQISSAMLFLHEHQLMHRDLTPYNLLYNDGSLRLCDFGVSVDLTGLPNATVPATPRADYNNGYLTGSQIIPLGKSLGDSCGNDSEDMHLEEDDVGEMELGVSYDFNFNLSPNGHYFYRAPEMNEGRPYSLAAEVYNFGSVLYECMTGTVLQAPEPFVLPRSPDAQNLRRSADGDRRRGGFPDELWRLQKACWERDPKKRPSFYTILETFASLQTRLSDSAPF